jgi:flagellar FliL protein
MDDAKPAEEAAPAPKPKKKGGFMKLLVILVVALVAIGGGAAYLLVGGSSAAEAEEPGLETRGLLAFDTLLVNLADNGGNRFLKVTLQLVLATPAEAAEIHKSEVVMSAIRSSMLELLTQQQASVLVTAEGKTALKKEIRDRVGAHLKQQKVIDVLFSEFVVQF